MRPWLRGRDGTGSSALQPLWGAGTPLARTPKGRRDAQKGPAQDPVRRHRGPRGHGVGTPKIGAGPLGAEEGLVQDTRTDTAGPGSPAHEGSGPCRAGSEGGSGRPTGGGSGPRGRRGAARHVSDGCLLRPWARDRTLFPRATRGPGWKEAGLGGVLIPGRPHRHL